jgi:hypothetical protein
MMDDEMHDEIDPQMERELAALADGSIAAERRDALLHEVESSPRLSAALASQRAAVTAIQATEATGAPLRLRASVEALAAGGAGSRRDAAPRSARRRFALPHPRLSLSLAGAAAVAIAVVVLVVGGEQAAPSVAQAAQLALSPASGGAPMAQGNDIALNDEVDGVAFPYWQDRYGWQAVGSRRDTLNGRMVDTVVYVDGQGRRLGYAIASGDALPVSGGTIVERNGTPIRVLRDPSGATVVTWLRDGHTCILAARDVPAGELVKLASYET